MAKEKVNELLKQLNTEIEQQNSLPNEEKERISNLVQNIEQGINEQNISEELSESVSDAITELEAKYPRLTAIINDIMVTLSNMGI